MPLDEEYDDEFDEEISGDDDDYDDDDDDVEVVSGEEVGRLLGRRGRRRLLGILTGGLSTLGRGSNIRRRIRRRRTKRRTARRSTRRGSTPSRRYRKATPMRMKSSSGKRSILGFGQQTLAAGASAVFDAVVQEQFSPEKLIVTGPSGDFEIATVSDIKIGVKSQFAGVEAVPAVTFRDTATGSLVDFDTAPAGITVSVLVTNNSANAGVYAVSMMGA